MKTTRASALLIALLMLVPASAFAQEARETSLIAGGGFINYDLSGTGNAAAFTARVSRDLTSNVVLEGSVLVAKPDQQFGPSTLVVPEAQLQYHFRAGRFRPYLGAGIGAARESSDFIDTDWTPTISFAGGTRVALSDRAGLVGEFRLRGFEFDFVGTTADIMGGVVIRLGR